MTDYGHELRFGNFIAPVNADPHRPVRLAQVVERSGLDLVTFQDHPYKASFHDTWTLMTWIAAATEHITVAGSVLNLPLRQPAVLARSAASLDLLSGGRFTMTLGAGAFWDAIAAMGGPRRTPGEAIDALGEALQIVRGVWEATNPRPLRVVGQHYQVSGARRGPEPAHDVPVWLGRYKPRGLRLVGREADGWLAGTSYLPNGDPAPGNAAIDEAAEEAGRDPAEIRRIITVAGSLQPVSTGYLQGPVDQWVEQLTALALQDGAGTLITMSDEPDFIRTFGEEIAPAVREAVAAERTSLDTKPAPTRPSTRVLARRREGIDYDGVPANLAERAVEPGDRTYDAVRHNYLRSGSPGLVPYPHDRDEVAEALAFARGQDVPLGVRSGGHGISGRSTNDGGIVLDLAAFGGVDVLDKKSFLYLSARRGTPQAQLLTVWAGDDQDAAAAALEPLAGSGPLLGHQTYRIPYSRAMPYSGGQRFGGGDPAARSGLVTHLDRSVSSAVADLVRSGGSSMIAVRAYGGAAHDVAPDATAYAHRHQQFSIGALGQSQAWLNDAWDAGIGTLTDGLYLSLDKDTRPERVHEAFPEETFARLARLKRDYDPQGVFSANFPIPSA